MPIALAPTKENLRRFIDASANWEDALPLTECAPVRDVLTPAACYHFYLKLQDSALPATRRFTTRATCFRREAVYEPLRRQWAFSMRELVCIGHEEEVTAFVAATRARVEALLSRLELPVEWRHATDPFFDPLRNPKFVAQKVAPLKTEAVYGGDLAISSTNLHRTYFGEAFDIKCGDQPATSACVGFGIERWLFAFLDHHGLDPAKWPRVV
jgi:seryl-tRNA synthetase